MTAPSRSNRLPPWFKVRVSTGSRFIRVQNRVREGALNTVCESAACPNRNECWNAGTATFLVLGNVCTRSCRFCNISSGRPEAPIDDEPERVAAAVEALRLDYAVITSVTRDDLPDGGASIFAATIRAVQSRRQGCKIEVLIPDLRGREDALQLVLDAGPDVLNHNIETVRSLYPVVRPQADYERSLKLLARAKTNGAVTKTGLMLGLGEGAGEVLSVLKDLRSAGCDILTLGQYLRPSARNVPVARYYRPDEFTALRKVALAAGFSTVVAGPLVRSSYHAGHYGGMVRNGIRVGGERDGSCALE